MILIPCSSVHASSTGSCYDTDTKLLIHADGADASTTFTDSSDSGHTITANGNAQVDTAQSKYGGASALFDGTGDFLSIADSDDWYFGTSDFTIDFWVRFASTATNTTLIGQWDVTTGSVGKSWLLQWQTSNNLTFFWTNDNSTNESATFSWTPSTNTWYHVALVRNGNDLMAFVDGTQIGFTADVTGEDLANVNATLWPQRTTDGSAVNLLNGWLDEVRVTKGTAVWTSSFTVPSSDYSVCGASKYITIS